jgi:hypothetical protein
MRTHLALAFTIIGTILIVAIGTLPGHCAAAAAIQDAGLKLTAADNGKSFDAPADGVIVVEMPKPGGTASSWCFVDPNFDGFALLTLVSHTEASPHLLNPVLPAHPVVGSPKVEIFVFHVTALPHPTYAMREWLRLVDIAPQDPNFKDAKEWQVCVTFPATPLGAATNAH